MSSQAAIVFDDSQPSPASERPRTAHLCAACQERPARFQYRGLVKSDRSHTLCFRCYRSMVDSIRNVEPVGRVVWLPSAGRRPRDWATGTVVPRSDKYVDLERRRRRAQIAARHALEEAVEA